MADAVKSALRVLQIIELLTAYPKGLAFPEICERLDLPKSSVHALLRTMRERGHLAMVEPTRVYRIGVRLMEAGEAFRREFSLVSLVSPCLESACAVLDETVQLAVLDGTDVVYVAKVESTQRLALLTQVGSRVPAYATALGKVLLSSLSEDELRRRLGRVRFQRFTENSIHTMSQLLKEIAAVREMGYATDNSEYTVGVGCIAVPIRDADGNTLAAVSVAVPLVRMSTEKRELIIELLQTQARNLQDSLVSPVT